MLLEGLTCAIGGCHMGITAEKSRAASTSRARIRTPLRPRASVAPRPPIEGGLFKRRDRSGSTFRRRKAIRSRSTPTNIRAPARRLRSWRALKPAFKKDGTVTAGNASGINDGAAAVVVATAERARSSDARRSRGSWRLRRPASTRRSWAWDRCRPCTKALERAKLKAADIDLFELNEAFAVAVGGGRARARPERGQGEHARRCDLARSPDRRERRPRADDARSTRCGRAAAATASRRCASAAAWASRWSSRFLLPDVRIDREALTAIVAHARRDAPNECCGLLVGKVVGVA